MSRFLKSSFKKLEPYTPGEQPKNPGLIKLNTNENPYPPCPAAMEIIREQAELVRLYPDPVAGELVKVIAERYGLEREQIITANGSDEVLAFSLMIFQTDTQKMYFPQISYGFYPVYSDVFGAVKCPVALTDDFRINIEDYKGLDGTIVIANPNAPTGIALTRDQIEEILKNNEGLVIIDEAYVDFGAESCVPLIDKYDNLLVIQTFSKSRGLAGARIGFAMGQKEIIDDLNTMKFSFNPYNINRMSIAAAAASMKDDAYFKKQCQKVIKTRENTIKRLTGLGFRVLPSNANFIFAKSGDLSGKAYFHKLREENILVRHFDTKPIEDFVRITIGTDEQMDNLIKVTERIIKNAKK